MYQNICYQRQKNLLTVWDDKHGMMQLPYKKYAYKKCANGKYHALDGTKVEKVTTWDDSDIARNLMFESDINPETRTLIDMYHETDEPSIGHRELFLDIEVSTEGGFAKPEDPWQPMTSIAFHDRQAKRSVAIIVDKNKKLRPFSDDVLTLEVVHNEFDLIAKFLEYYIQIAPTIITGWNIDFFDIPYIYNRITRVAGAQYANSLSPVGEVIYLKHRNRYRILGVSSLDYMALYKLFTQNEEVSYSLDAISKKELGKGKTVYEGSLDMLYNRDPEKFVEYNVNDVILVLELDEKLKYLALARGICHKGHVPYEDVYFTTRYLDGACITYMKRLGVIVPNRKLKDYSQEEVADDGEEKKDGFAGAFVKDPIPGLYEWTFDEDMKALYPSIIRTLNMSFETKVGRITNWDEIKETFWDDTYSNTKAHLEKGAHHELISMFDLRPWLVDNKYCVSAIGVVYDSKKQGLIPSILEAWGNEREEFRALAKKFAKEGNSDMSEFFDNRQQVAKRMNNSLYGALGAPGFRFYDLDNAESTTLTGQLVVKHAMSKGNEWFVKQTGVKKDYVIYVDTDSTFLSAAPLITMMENKIERQLTEIEKAGLTFKTSQIVENFINDSWDVFAKQHLNADTHFFEIKQEYVASAGFWIARKRYAQMIISEKGTSIHDITNGEKEWKLDVKGMDVVRSDFPKAFRVAMSDILISILKKADKQVIDDKVIGLRESIKTSPLYDIMFPTGIKDLNKYFVKKAEGQVFGERPKGTPIHAKSSLNYNDLMDYYSITKSEPIISGEKIKWTYLKQNPFGLNTCALKGFDDPVEIIKFITDNIDYDHIFESSLENKLTDFYNALQYGKVPKDKNMEEFFSFG